MTIETRRLGRTLLFAAGLCGCASQQHTEAASHESAAVAAEGDEAAEAVDEAADKVEVKSERVAEEGHTSRNHARTTPADPDAREADESHAPSNTAVNERDRDGDTLTPGDQSNSKTDLEITRRIRENVVDDDSLSFTAKNVKIITVDGRVTLRGPVRSEAERNNIEKKALAVAGAGQVDCELEVE